MHYVYGFVHHLRQLRRWAKKESARMRFDALTFQLDLTLEQPSRRVSLLPKFVTLGPDRQAMYTFEFGETGRFVGWLPYRLKQWPAASDKIVFKRYCQDAGLRVPHGWQFSEPASADYIVKPRDGSFGRGIRGPFQQGQTPELVPPLSSEDYCEQFIPGRAVKIWYWNDQPQVMECVSPPYAVGDGRRSLSALIGTARGSFDRVFDLSDCKDMLAWQGHAVDDVVEAGKQVVLDFRYATPFDPIDLGNRNVLVKQGPERLEELRLIGECLYRSVPDAFKPGALYTVDGVLDADDRLWLLEMNCNPVVHPDCYPAILDSLR